MSFDIYDVSQSDSGPAPEALEEDHIEFDLSPGELRQSLMDRFQRLIQDKEYHYLILNMRLLGLSLTEDELQEVDDNGRSILLDVENAVYEMVDQNMDGSVWEFSNERILVKGEIYE